MLLRKNDGNMDISDSAHSKEIGQISSSKKSMKKYREKISITWQTSQIPKIFFQILPSSSRFHDISAKNSKSSSHFSPSGQWNESNKKEKLPQQKRSCESSQPHRQHALDRHFSTFSTSTISMKGSMEAITCSSSSRRSSHS